MNKKSIFKAIAIAGILTLGANAANAQLSSDTSKVCTGQTTLPKGPDAPQGVTYAYAWFDAANNNAGTTQEITLSGTTLTNNTSAPIQFVYKLVVSQSGVGVAVCPSDTFYKVILVYPALSNTLTSNYATICAGNQIDLVLTSPTSAGSTPNTPPTMFGNYGAVNYAWTGSGIPPSTTTTGIANNTYTISSANLPQPNTTAYTYSAVVSYVETLLGTSTVLAACKSSNDVSVTITTAPAITNTSVTTSFQ